jgi:hypothetical protein
MKLKQTEYELTINEAPGCLWIFGLFFMAIGGLFVYGSLGGFTNSGSVPFWQLALAFFMGLTGVAAGLWIIYRAPVTRVTVDTDKKIIIHERTGITGRNSNYYNLDHAKEFSLIEENDDEGDPIWSLGLVLKDGEIVRISSLPSHSESVKRNFLFEANRFLHRQMPSWRDEDEVKDEKVPSIS